MLPKQRTGHELIFGHYLERAFDGKLLPKVKELLKIQGGGEEGKERYLTLEGVNLTRFQAAKAHVIHPIKTKEEQKQLITMVTLKRYL